jgi:hypothetical protein
MRDRLVVAVRVVGEEVVGEEDECLRLARVMSSPTEDTPRTLHVQEVQEGKAAQAVVAATVQRNPIAEVPVLDPVLLLAVVVMGAVSESHQGWNGQYHSHLSVVQVVLGAAAGHRLGWDGPVTGTVVVAVTETAPTTEGHETVQTTPIEGLVQHGQSRTHTASSTIPLPAPIEVIHYQH